MARVPRPVPPTAPDMAVYPRMVVTAVVKLVIRLGTLSGSMT